MSHPTNEAVDLLIVGGDINGAGIARDAAGRGSSVALVEQDDLASHTSSASTKLIHGRLRYLENGEFLGWRRCSRTRGGTRIRAIAGGVTMESLADRSAWPDQSGQAGAARLAGRADAVHGARRRRACGHGTCAGGSSR